MKTVLGYEEIHAPDVRGSEEFLDMLITSKGMGITRALDCGAGIGRVTKYVLEPRFAEIDLVDQSESLLTRARTFITTSKPINFYAVGLQSFTPVQQYDCIWVQWVSSQLTDEDLISFYQRAKAALQSGGCLCVKENIKKKGFVLHKDDFSVTRCEEMYQIAFNKAGLQVVAEAWQKDFPEDIYQVKMWALQPLA